MLTLGLLCLRFVLKKDARKTFLVGFGVSCIHHLALFTNNMRGYTSISALIITLSTEWPALVVAEHAIRTLFLKHLKLAKYARHALLIIFVAIVSNHVQLEHIDRVLLPNLPGVHMQSFGTAMFRLTTCAVPKFLLPEPLPCRRTPEDDAILVVATPAKSGALLAGKILLDVGMSCHFCVASGERSRAGIPGPVESNPTYKGEMLHAIINMRDWGTRSNSLFSCFYHKCHSNYRRIVSLTCAARRKSLENQRSNEHSVMTNATIEQVRTSEINPIDVPLY